MNLKASFRNPKPVRVCAVFAGLTLLSWTAYSQSPPVHVLPNHRVVQLQPSTIIADQKALATLLAARNSFVSINNYKTAGTPNVADTLRFQTAIKDQGARSTCTYFAATAALEAAYKKAGYGDLNLSEQYLVWLRNVTMLTDDKPTPPAIALTNALAHENQLGSISGGSSIYNFELMTHYGVGPASSYPYISSAEYENPKSAYYAGFGLGNFSWSNSGFPQPPIDAWNMAASQSPFSVQDGNHYGLEKFEALNGAQFHDPGCIEYLIASGYSVVVDLTVYPDHSTPARPIWTKSLDMHEVAEGGHTMLIVGYDRVRHLFIVKNSWGPVHYDVKQLAPDLTDIATKYEGYTLLDYNYLPEVYAAGFITQVATPNAPKYANQSLMGSWTLTVKNLMNGHVVFTGTLSWRHLPGTDFNMDGRETRIGDLYGKLNGGPARNYRVNGAIGNLVSIYVDFAHPAAGLTSQPGLRFSGVLNRFAHQLLIPYGSVFGTETLAGISAQSLGFTLVRS